MKTLKSRTAEGFIDIAVTVVIFAMLVMIMVFTTQLIVLNQRLDSLCDNLLETATAYGQFGDAYNEQLRAAQEKYTGLVAVVSGSGEVQYGKKMQLTLTLTGELRVFGGLTVPVTVQVSKYGLSEKYWK